MKKLLTILCFILLFGCTRKTNDSNKEQIYNDLFINFTEVNILIDYGSEFLPNSIIIDSNGTVTLPASIDTSVIGTNSIIYKVSSIEYPDIEKEYVVTVTVRDVVSEIFWKFQQFICSNKEYFYFKNIKNDPISIILNPDGNVVNTNFSISYTSIDRIIYQGKFTLIKDNLYSFGNGKFYEDNIYSNDKPDFGNGIDGYFKLEDNRLYFITDILSVEEMENYSSDIFCSLR